MAVTEAQARATEKYSNMHYDTITAKLPKGTKEIIQFISEDTVSMFVKKAVLDRIYRIEHEMEVDVYDK